MFILYAYQMFKKSSFLNSCLKFVSHMVHYKPNVRHKHHCTYDNDDDCSENIYKVWYRAFSNERPFYQSLYLILLDLVVVVDNEDIGNIIPQNAKPLNDILTLLHQLLNNCIQLHHIRIYYKKNITIFYISLNSFLKFLN